MGPQVLRLAVTPRGWRARTAQTIAQALPEAAAPEAVGHELATALAASVRPGAAVHIVLSNHHVRYAVVGDAAVELVREGRTSLEEINRVTFVA